MIIDLMVRICSLVIQSALGYVTTVLSKEGYEYLKTIAPECLPRVLPVYHGYHEDMKHNCNV